MKRLKSIFNVLCFAAIPLGDGSFVEGFFVGLDTVAPAR